MTEQNVQKYEVGDRVYMNEKLYKVVHVYDDGRLKLKSIRGKIDETIFRVPVEFVTMEQENF